MIDQFKRHRILEMLRVLTPASTFILSTFFNRVRTFDTESVKIDIKQNKRRLAPFVNPQLAGFHVEREGYLTRTFSPAYVKPLQKYQPSDLYRRAAGQPLESSSQRLDAIIAEDLQDLQDQVTRREEWMAVQALLNGTVQVTGEGVNELVDFQRPASHTVTLAGGALWSAGTANILQDIRGWRRLINQDSGRRADTVVVSPDVGDIMLQNDALKAELDTRRVTLGQFMPRELDESVTYLGDLNSGQVSIFAYEDWYVDDAGVEQPMMPAGAVIVGASGARSERLFGAIEDFDAGGLAEAQWFPKTWMEDDPSVTNLLLQSAPLPSPVEVNAYLSASVL